MFKNFVASLILSIRRRGSFWLAWWACEMSWTGRNSRGRPRGSFALAVSAYRCCNCCCCCCCYSWRYAKRGRPGRRQAIRCRRRATCRPSRATTWTCATRRSSSAVCCELLLWPFRHQSPAWVWSDAACRGWDRTCASRRCTSCLPSWPPPPTTTVTTVTTVTTMLTTTRMRRTCSCCCCCCCCCVQTEWTIGLRSTCTTRRRRALRASGRARQDWDTCSWRCAARRSSDSRCGPRRACWISTCTFRASAPCIVSRRRRRIRWSWARRRRLCRTSRRASWRARAWRARSCRPAWAPCSRRGTGDRWCGRSDTWARTRRASAWCASRRSPCWPRGTRCRLRSARRHSEPASLCSHCPLYLTWLLSLCCFCQ